MAAEKKAVFVEITKNEKEIKKISETTQKILENESSITITNANVIPTIAYTFLRTVAAWLGDNKSTESDVLIDVMGLMEMGVSYRESEDGEANGNFTPFIVPGPEFKQRIKDNELTENED